MFEILSVFDKLPLQGKIIITILTLALLVISILIFRWSSTSSSTIIPGFMALDLFIYKRFLELCIVCTRLDQDGWLIALTITAGLIAVYLLVHHLGPISGALIWGFGLFAAVMWGLRMGTTVVYYIQPLTIALLLWFIWEVSHFSKLRLVCYVIVGIILSVLGCEITAVITIVMFVEAIIDAVLRKGFTEGLFSIAGVVIAVIAILTLMKLWLYSWVVFLIAYIIYKLSTR